MTIRRAYLDRCARRIVTAHMIGSARPVGRAAKCEDDDTDWSAGRTEELIVRADYPISVIEQVLCVLQARLPRCRVDIDRHPPAGGRPDELRGPREARPLRGRRRVPLLKRSHCRSCGRFDRMTHGPDLRSLAGLDLNTVPGVGTRVCGFR